MQGLLGYTIRRLLWLPVILFVVSFFAFTHHALRPGRLRRRPRRPARRSDEAKERLREETGLNDPFYVQYGALHEAPAHRRRLRRELHHLPRRDVWDIIWPRMLVSVQPGIVALFITFSLGIPVGLFAALRQGTWLDPFVDWLVPLLPVDPRAGQPAIPRAALRRQARLAAGDRLGRPARRRRAAGRSRSASSQAHHPARDRALAAGHRRRRAPRPRDDALGAGRGLRAHRAREGPAGARRSSRATSRATRCCRS